MSEKKFTGLSGEYKRFNKIIKPLRKLHKETFQAINNVSDSEDLSPEQVQSFSASSMEMDELNHLLNAPLTIIIAGQDNYGKVIVLTKLLGTRLLPFTGPQHTCNTVNSSSFIHSTSFEGGLCCSKTEVHDNTVFKETFPSASSSFDSRDQLPVKSKLCTNKVSPKSDNEKQERPWRGIRINYSYSQVAYSVVRPESVGSSCKCDGEESLPSAFSSKISAPANTPNTFQFSVQTDQPSFSAQAAAGPNSEITSKFDCHSEQPEEVPTRLKNATTAVPPLPFDMTVAQLEDLLEHKFQSHLKQKNCIQSDTSLCGPEDNVKEVPLSEIELTNEHLQDPILRDALLDVGLNHCLLKEQLQVIVTPTINKYKCSRDPKNGIQLNQSFLGTPSDASNALPNSLDDCANVVLDAEVKDSPHRSTPMDIPSTRVIPPTPRNKESSLINLGSENKCSNLIDALIDTQSPSLVFGTPASSLFHSNFRISTPSLPSSRSTSHESLCSFKSLPIEYSMYQTPNASCMHLLGKQMCSFSNSASPEPSELMDSANPNAVSCHTTAKISTTVLPGTTENSKPIEEANASNVNTHATDGNSAKPTVEEFSTPLPKPPSPVGSLPSAVTRLGATSEPLPDNFINCSTVTVETLAEECMGFMGTLLPHVNALILYAVTKDHFTSQNIDELQEIRHHSPPCPVMFVRVPPILDALTELSSEDQRGLLIDTGILRQPSALPPETEEVAENSAKVKSSFVGKGSTQKKNVPIEVDLTNVEKSVPVPTEVDQTDAKKSAPTDVDDDGTKSKPPSEDDLEVSAGLIQSANVKPLDAISAVESPISTSTMAGATTPTQDPTLPGNEKRLSSPDEYDSPTGYQHEGHPMVFVMDNTPVTEACLADEVRPVKGKTVKFTDDAHDNERKLNKHVVSPKSADPRLGKRDKNCITAGNCCEGFSGEEAKKIRKVTSDIYELAQKQYDNAQPTSISRHTFGNSAGVHDSESRLMKSIIKKQGGKNWCKMPDEILHVISEDLGFLSDDGCAGLHIAHCHLMWEDVNMSEISRNPFVQTYNRKSHSSPEPVSNNESSVLSDSYNDSDEITCSSELTEPECSELCVECGIIESFADFDQLHLWTKRILRSHVAYTSELLGKIQGRCLSSFVVFAFEFSRQLQIAPRRLAYARQQEEQLYEDLLAVARNKEENIRLLIANTLQLDRSALLCTASNSPLEGGAEKWECVVQECVLREINNRVGEQLTCRVQGLRENCLGTLRRCLAQLEQHCSTHHDQPSVSFALKKLVNAAYQVEIRPTSSWGLLRGVWERIRELLTGGGPTARDDEETLGRRAAPGTREWKRQVASDMIKGLSEKRLARTISAQISGEIKAAHSMFLSNMELLEHQLTNSLTSTEHQQHQLKSVHAPKLAKLALHTDAINNKVKYGLPVLGGELGRGHFGVVYSCKGWAQYSPCAVKTLLPRDPTQWRDIALQYHYTRLMGSHPRIVGIHACLIDKYYGETRKPYAARGMVGRERWGSGGSRSGAKAYGGKSAVPSNQCVLLVMDVHECDLDTAIRRGLMWFQRLRIALDVVQGIRFLHSQGLIHRDIKPKNILIDAKGRAKVTDLDFCKPEAMMTGSIVGTPIHMAPELFSGTYDSSVDIYAFGVLFWYLCSGKTNMPRNFCLQKSKEDLKFAVYRGVRPECLATFSPDCWAIMEQCWAPEPRERILLGLVEERLTKMLKKCLDDMKEEDGNSTFFNTTGGSENSDNDSYSSISDDSD